jgi:hypothetical protein
MLASPAFADGEFSQLDLSQNTQNFSSTISRDAWSIGGNAAKYDGGRSGSIHLTYGVPLGDIATAHVGPTIGLQTPDNSETDYDIGVFAALDRYIAAGFGGVYGLAQASTIDDAWFVLGQFNFTNGGFGLEISSGGSDSYSETTIALQKQLSGTPVSLRSGYKLDTEQYFIGFSFNTF